MTTTNQTLTLQLKGYLKEAFEMAPTPIYYVSTDDTITVGQRHGDIYSFKFPFKWTDGIGYLSIQNRRFPILVDGDRILIKASLVINKSNRPVTMKCTLNDILGHSILPSVPLESQSFLIFPKVATFEVSSGRTQSNVLLLGEQDGITTIIIEDVNNPMATPSVHKAEQKRDTSKASKESLVNSSDIEKRNDLVQNSAGSHQNNIVLKNLQKIKWFIVIPAMIAVSIFAFYLGSLQDKNEDKNDFDSKPFPQPIVVNEEKQPEKYVADDTVLIAAEEDYKIAEGFNEKALKEEYHKLSKALGELTCTSATVDEFEKFCKAHEKYYTSDAKNRIAQYRMVFTYPDNGTISSKLNSKYFSTNQWILLEKTVKSGLWDRKHKTRPMFSTKTVWDGTRISFNELKDLYYGIGGVY